MDAASIAALATAFAGLLAAAAQWSWLIGPRRTGHRARLHTIEDRLAASELALQRCLRRLHASRQRTRQVLHDSQPAPAQPAQDHGSSQDSPQPHQE